MCEVRGWVKRGHKRRCEGAEEKEGGEKVCERWQRCLRKGRSRSSLKRVRRLCSG